jgi:hypothetical protein
MYAASFGGSGVAVVVDAVVVVGGAVVSSSELISAAQPVRMNPVRVVAATRRRIDLPDVGCCRYYADTWRFICADMNVMAASCLDGTEGP